MTSFYIVPGVYPRELDLSAQNAPISTSTGALVFGSRKGTMDVYYETNVPDFNTIFGPSDFSWTFGHAIVKSFLVISNGIYLKRVTNGATHAGSIVTNDVNGADATSTSFQPFLSGSQANYQTGSRQLQNITFSGPLLAGNSISIILTSNYNNVTHTITQAFVANNDVTLASLATAINNQLTTDPWIVDGYAVGGCVVEDVDLSLALGNANNRTLRIVSPENTTVTIQSIAVTPGSASSAPSAHVATTPWLLEVWAENPGSWAGNLAAPSVQNVGYRILNIDNGIAQRIQLAFSSPMLTGMGFNMVIELNGIQVPFSSVSFSVDHPTTMASLANAIETALGDHSEVILDTDGFNLDMTIISPVDGPNTLSIINPTVIGGINGAIIPTVVASTVLTGIASSQTFDFWVYTRGDTNVPVEKFTCSFLNQIDGNGIQLFIEDQINSSASRSDYIRVNYNTLNGAASLTGLIDSGIQWLNGGTDGSLPTNSQIATAWNTYFSSRKTVPCRIMLNGGYSSPVVQQMMDSICQSRWDCFAILDMPTQYQQASDAVNYRNNFLDISSSYSAIYSPNVQITDSDTGQTLYIPPSGNVGAKFAYNDSVAAEWYAPAGLNRGLLLNVTGLSQTYDEVQEALLISNQINPLIKESGIGYQIKSANTLQTRASALSNINVRRLLITIEVSLVQALNYSVYEPNTAFTRALIVQLTTNFLQPIKDNSGLYDFAVVCDDRNNPSYLIDEGQADVDIYLKPVIPIKFIQLTSVITKTGAYFQEIVAAVSATTSSASFSAT